MLSVVICTVRKSKEILANIEVLLKSDIEIIVVDNSKEFVLKDFSIDGVRVIHEPNPGLHNTRHRGALEATNEIISFTDDDVVVSEGWVDAVIETFQTTNAVLVGGKILPVYEVTPPEWINDFRNEFDDGGYSLGQLSLLDFGDELKEISPNHVWGCNYSIKKNVLWECGGFHPDLFPAGSQMFMGDGETGLSSKIRDKGYNAYYNPEAIVYHYIPKERLTVDYFCQRLWNQGIFDSFTNLRKSGGIQNEVRFRVFNAYHEGRVFHRKAVAESEELREWILKEEYYSELCK